MNDLKRYTVHITGIVQGVGMRPYICKAANQLGLCGWVSNQGTALVMEIACRSEYESPDNRRFHSQTNCCPD